MGIRHRRGTRGGAAVAIERTAGRSALHEAVPSEVRAVLRRSARTNAGSDATRQGAAIAVAAVDRCGRSWAVAEALTRSVVRRPVWRMPNGSADGERSETDGGRGASRDERGAKRPRG